MNLGRGLVFGAASASLLFVSVSARAQITLGQIDTFQDGTVQSWNGFDVVNNPTGGPAGSGDAFLQVTSEGGSGPGSKLATYNNVSWQGNYMAAGVTAVKANIRNQGNLTLQMRVCVIGFNGDRWTSTTAVPLLAGGGWQTVYFSLNESALTRVLGSNPFSGAITSVERIMIRHDANAPSAGGTPIASQMGLDNIQAVPEPASMAAMALGAAMLLRRRKRA